MDELYHRQHNTYLYYLGRGLSGLITVLEDKQYMVTVREKMNNIKKVAKFYNYDFLNAGK